MKKIKALIWKEWRESRLFFITLMGILLASRLIIELLHSIIKNMDTNNDSYLIAKTITDFSKKLGIKTIAEYIHSDAVYTKAKEIGVDEFQGFLLAEPKPLD